MPAASGLADLHAHGLILQDAESRDRTTPPIAAVSEPSPDDRYDLVVVPVRAEQLKSTLPVLTAMTDGSDVLFFGNTAKRQAELADALGQRALFGFPVARRGPRRLGHQVCADHSAEDHARRTG